VGLRDEQDVSKNRKYFAFARIRNPYHPSNNLITIPTPHTRSGTFFFFLFFFFFY
jgi:hypothetical protein